MKIHPNPFCKNPLKILQLSIVFMLLFISSCSHPDWRTADRSSIGLAPSPEKESRAVVQVYAARAFAWRGYFAVHSWIATKKKDADHYTVYQVLGYRLANGSSVVIADGIPDARWYGSAPFLIEELIGEKAEAAIPVIHEAALSYPYKGTYTIWPGPNSNTFISHIIRRVPELGVELPSSAIGKDWLSDGGIFAYSETGTGVQLSLYGLLGFTIGLGDGIEMDILGLSFGVDLWRPAIKLPFVGRLGFPDAAVF